MWAIYWQDIEVKHGKRIGTEQKIQGPNSAVLLQLFLLQFMRTKGGGGPLPLTNHSLSDLGFFSGRSCWFFHQLAWFHPLNNSGGAAFDFFDFTYLSILPTLTRHSLLYHKRLVWEGSVDSNIARMFFDIDGKIAAHGLLETTSITTNISFWYNGS